MMRILPSLALAVLVACTPPPPRIPDAPPPERYALAEIPGFPGVRTFYDGSYEPGREELAAFVRQRRKAGLDHGRFTILALSGGGPDGAFGAGFLRGWSEHGDRPVFDVVTGVSTGALIAPFAFLGPEFDDELERFYTNVSTENLLTFTLFRALFGGSAVADTEPLRQILRATVDDALTAQIAAEHGRGRRLLVATTHIDSQRPVIWDLGAIAATGRPDAPELIRKVMLASASIPGAFPPVLFQVEADGETYQEVHVDGGVTLSIFAYPPSVNLGLVADALGVPRSGRTLYLIRNAKLLPEYAPPPLGVIEIAQRSVSTLIKSQTLGNLLAAEGLAARDGFAFRLAFVPDSFNRSAEELFDRDYMRALYDLGYTLAREGYRWLDSVLGLLGRAGG